MTPIVSGRATGRLGGAQSGRIRSGQRGTSLQAGHRLQEAHDLVRSKDYGQFARRAGMRNPLRQIGLLERNAVQETKRADRLVQCRPRHPAGDKVDLKGPHVLQAEPIRRAAEKRPNWRPHARRMARRRRQIADRHVLDHAAAQRLISVIGGLPSRVGVQHPTLADHRPILATADAATASAV